MDQLIFSKITKFKTLACASIAISVFGFSFSALAQGPVATFPSAVVATQHHTTTEQKKNEQAEKEKRFKALMAKLTPAQRETVLKFREQIMKQILYHFSPPNPSMSSPNAMSGKGGAFSFGAGYVSHWNGTTKSDGFGTLGMVIGDPFKYVSFAINSNLDSVGLRNDPFGANSAIGFQFNRYIIPGLTSVAVGIGNAISFGSFRNSSSNYYATVTQFLPLAIPVAINVGAGTGAFYSVADARAVNDNHWGLFAGVGVSVYQGLSVIADYTTRQYTVGASYVFHLIHLPFFVSAGCANVGKYGGFKPHFQGSVGFSIPFEKSEA